MRHLNVRKLKKSLDSLCEVLDEYYDINCGGCCFVAYIISKHLERLKIRYKLVIYSEYSKDKDAISNEIINRVASSNSKQSIIGENTCNHYCIYIYGGGIVNGGDRCNEKKYIISGISPIHLKWIYNHGLWNTIYDRKNNKLISNSIKSFFNKL